MTCEDCGWKSVNPSGAIFCGYTDLRTWEDESCCAWKPARVGVTPYTEEDWKRTNADRIRAMSDKELASFLWNRDMDIVEKASKAIGFTFRVDEEQCLLNVLDWLRQEAE